MSICACWVEHPKSVIGRYYEEAMGMVDSWVTYPGHEAIGEAMFPWPFIQMSESIAYRLLVTAGYDVALIDMATDMDPPKGWSMGDLFAEMERTKGIELPVDWEPGSPLP